MSNERLRAAIHQAGLEIDQLAASVGADPKTVRRWIAGREPRGLYRTRLAQALGRSEQELWPELDLKVSGRDERGEILAAYARASDLATPDWRTLLTQAHSTVELLDPTLAEIIAANPATLELLADRAAEGCEIRLLIASPGSAHHALTDAEHSHDLTLMDVPPSARQAERSLTLIRPVLADERIQARMFVTAHNSTILRFDNELLITLHLYATPTTSSPLLHVQRHSDHGLFERFTTHFEAIWQHARPLSPPATPDG